MRKLPIRLHLKNGGYYYVHQNKWTNLGRDYGEALKQYAVLMAPKAKGMAGLVARYMEQVKVKPKTLKTYKVVSERLKVAFVEFSPEQVKPKHFYELMTAKKITDAMAGHYRSVMVGAMDLAVKEGLVDQNLMREVQNYASKKRDRYLTDGEFTAIRNNAPDTLQCIMDVASLTGQRIGDVLKIRYADLTDEGIVFVQEKTDTRLCVSWNPDLQDTIARIKELHQSVKGMTLFHTRQGKPLPYWTIRSQWDKAVTLAGVENAHIHDIRAKTATDAKKAGLDSKALLGHKSESVHMRYLRGKETPVVQGVKRVKA